VVGWMEGHQGRLTTVTVLWPRRAGKGGGGGFARRACTGGDYEPKATLVELGAGHERARRARRKESNDDWGAPGSGGPVRA